MPRPPLQDFCYDKKKPCCQRYQCSQYFSLEHQKELRDKFTILNANGRREFYIQHCQRRKKIGRRTGGGKVFREANIDYHLRDEKGELRNVCQSLFSNILSIRDKTVKFALKNYDKDTNTLTLDKRGRYERGQEKMENRKVILDFIMNQHPIPDTKLKRLKFPGFDNYRDLYRKKYKHECANPCSESAFWRLCFKGYNILTGEENKQSIQPAPSILTKTIIKPEFDVTATKKKPMKVKENVNSVRLTCAVANCQKNIISEDQLIQFPVRDEVQRKLWIRACQKMRLDPDDNWMPTEDDKICKEHFVNGTVSKLACKPNYVPTLFSSHFCYNCAFETRHHSELKVHIKECVVSNIITIQTDDKKLHYQCMLCRQINLSKPLIKKHVKTCALTGGNEESKPFMTFNSSFDNDEQEKEEEAEESKSELLFDLKPEVLLEEKVEAKDFY